MPLKSTVLCTNPNYLQKQLIPGHAFACLVGSAITSLCLLCMGTFAACMRVKRAARGTIHWLSSLKRAHLLLDPTRLTPLQYADPSSLMDASTRMV